MSVGGLEVYNSGQSSAVVEIPYWWSFPVALTCLVVLSAVTVYTMARSIRGMRA